MIKNQSAKESEEKTDILSDWEEVSDDQEEQNSFNHKPISCSVIQMVDQAATSHNNSKLIIKKGMVTFCHLTSGNL